MRTLCRTSIVQHVRNLFTSSLSGTDRHGAVLNFIRACIGVLALLGMGGLRSTAAENSVTLEVFVRNDFENCRQGAEFARDLAKQRNGIELRVLDVLADDEALRRYWSLMKRHEIEKPGLPVFHVFDQIRTGFGDAKVTGPIVEELLTIDVFTRDGCPHCRDAKRFLAELLPRWPALRVAYHDASQDGPALRQMYELAKKHKQIVTGLPAIHVGGKFFVGYLTDDISGRQIEAVIRKMVLPPRKEPPPPTPPKQGKETNSPQGAALPSPRILTAFGLISPVSIWREFAMLEPQANLPNDVAPPPPPPRPPPPPSSPLAPPPPPPEDSSTSSDLNRANTDNATANNTDSIELPWLGVVRVRDLGLPLFSFVIGLVDGFNPCAMWVLVFLLSVLVNVKNRAKILVIAGTFVVVSGLAYFAFMAAWMNLFMLIGMARPLQIALGVVALIVGVVNVKDFFAFKRGISLSIPESAKPGIYARVRNIVAAKYLTVAIGSAVVLAIVVNTIELLCTAGLPALYTQILTSQQLPTWMNYGYMAIYIVAYMLDDSLLLGTFVITLSHRKLQESEGRWLKIISGVVILILGIAMIFRPDWLRLT